MADSKKLEQLRSLLGHANDILYDVLEEEDRDACEEEQEPLRTGMKFKGLLTGTVYVIVRRMDGYMLVSTKTWQCSGLLVEYELAMTVKEFFARSSVLEKNYVKVHGGS